MSGTISDTSAGTGVPPSRQQATATRHASGRRIRLLSAPDSEFARAVPPDDRFGISGRVRCLLAYDANMPPPPLPPRAVGHAFQRLTAGAAAEAIVERLRPRLALTLASQFKMHQRIEQILDWLAGFDGDTWEERWLSSGADAAPRSWAGSGFPDLAAEVPRAAVTGAYHLIQARTLRPSYAWLLDSRPGNRGLHHFFELNAGPLLGPLRALPAYLQANAKQQRDAEQCLARVMVRTGKPLGDIRGEDLLHYADVVRTSGRHRREHLAWELLVALGIFAGEPATLRAAWSAKGNTRQHSVATLVDRYGIPKSGVRDLLVDYLNEVKPGMDYASLTGLAYRLVRTFWWEVLQINPQQADLRLSPETIVAWRERFALTTDGKPRREIHSTLFGIRAFYRDLSEWAHDDPARWGVWVAPCPIPRTQSRTAAKEKRQQKATTQARTRALTPLLPRFLAAADERRDWGRRLLDAALAADQGGVFTVDGVTFARCQHRTRYDYLRPARTWANILHSEPGAPPVPLEGGRVNVSRLEEDGFWSWAVTHTLRLTGVRIEELLELTQLSLRHYTPPTANTLVPLLHIVPSKTDAERLIPMSPELVTVLLAVQRRVKDPATGQVPLSIRYDPHEKLHGEPLPHVFARRFGTRQEVLSPAYVRALLIDTAAWAGLCEKGEAVFTPHDFRRLFTTELVGAGLPLHIVSSLLGHLSLDTTRGYTAVFPEHLVAAHDALIERRRQLRPDGEMRPATGEEWVDFEQHFLLRKIALGSCHRPYGTPCVHEHACTRCRFLKVDPAQLGRIEEMTSNAEDRLVEAREKVWLGEVVALEETLTHLRRRRAEAESQLADVQVLDSTTIRRGTMR
jgi:integrase